MTNKLTTLTLLMLFATSTIAISQQPRTAPPRTTPRTLPASEIPSPPLIPKPQVTLAPQGDMIMVNGKLYALVNTPSADSVTITGMGIPTDPNQQVDIGDVITKSDKTQPTRATRPPQKSVSTPVEPVSDLTDALAGIESLPSVTPLPPTPESSEVKQPNNVAVEKTEIIYSLLADRLEDEKAAAQKEMDESLAKLAKLAIEQKKIDATLALVRKIKSPSVRAKTLSDLATYIAHDPNFKYEAQVLFKEATVATLALDELELEAMPELKELTTITAKKVNTPVQPVTTPPTTPPVTNPTPTSPESPALTIPEQIDSTPKPQGIAPPRLTGANPTPSPVAETPTLPPITDTNPDAKINVPQKRRMMPSATPSATATPGTVPALTDEVQDDNDVTLEPKRSK